MTKLTLSLAAILWANALGLTKATFITKEVSPNGAVLVEPIHSTLMLLEPRNGVARATKGGEALVCEMLTQANKGIINYENVVVHTIILDCDGAQFAVIGLKFERSER